MIRRIARESLPLLMGDAFARLALFGATVWMARQLGPAAFGLVTFAQAVLGYLLLAGEFGLSIHGVREMAVHPHSRARTWRTVVALRTVLTTSLVAVALAITFAVPAAETTRLVMSCTLLVALPLALVPDWAFRAVGRMDLAALVGALQPAVLLVGAIALVHAPDDVLWVPLLRLIAAVVAATLGVVLLLRLRHGEPAGSRAEPVSSWRDTLSGPHARTALASGGVLLLANLAVLAYNSGDSLLLKWFLGDSAVGLYSSAYRVIQVPLAAFNAVTFAAFPLLARMASGDASEARRLTGRLMSMALVAGVLAALGIAWFAGPVVRALFGTEYLESAAVLRVLAFVVPLDFVVSTLGTAHVAAGRERPLAWCAGSAAVLNLIANMALIPRLGLLGAAWATIGTYVLLWMLYVFAIRDGSAGRSA